MVTKRELVRSRPLSITLAIDSLVEQQQIVEEHRAALQEQIGIRDQLIADMIVNGIPYKRISQITGLSRNRIWQIGNQTQGSTGSSSA